MIGVGVDGDGVNLNLFAPVLNREVACCRNGVGNWLIKSNGERITVDFSGENLRGLFITAIAIVVVVVVV